MSTQTRRPRLAIPTAATRAVTVACLATGAALGGCADGRACVRPAPPNLGTLDAGTIVRQAVPPPPLSGGTLTVLHDGHTAVAADPDYDRVWVVDLVLRSVRARLDLMPGDEPGRVVEDAAGRVHVALRRGGAVVTLDPATGAQLDRRAVCAAPRGVAYDPSRDALHVACAGGELVTLGAGGGPATRTLRLAPDLRDVVLDHGRLLVSTFRAAQVLVVDGDGAVTARWTLPGFTQDRTGRSQGATSVVEHMEFTPEVAYRMAAVPTGGVVISHQRAKATPLVESPPGTGGGYYGAGASTTPLCVPGVVDSTVSRFGPDGVAPVAPVLALGLPLDVAVSPSGRHVAYVSAGQTPSGVPGSTIYLDGAGAASRACGGQGGPVWQVRGTAVAVAFVDEGSMAVQTRVPAEIAVGDLAGQRFAIPLPEPDRLDTGHTIFHAVGTTTCAHCHPEGEDDGHVWVFPCDGPRRTQSVRGGILATAPFHWDGHLATFRDLATEVFSERLRAPAPTAEQADALGAWLDGLPAVPSASPPDAAAVERGRRLFESPAVGCASCHGGPMFTNNATTDVGTGGAFQVPSLRGLLRRAPYFHDGSVATLRDRFLPPANDDRHGHTTQLDAAAVDDLVAYLATL